MLYFLGVRKAEPQVEIWGRRRCGSQNLEPLLLSPLHIPEPGRKPSGTRTAPPNVVKMGGKVRLKEDPICTSGPPWHTRRHERLIESFVWDYCSSTVTGSAVPAVPVSGAGRLSQQEEAPRPE